MTRYEYTGDGTIADEGLVPVDDTVFIGLYDTDLTDKGIVSSRPLVALTGAHDLDLETDTKDEKTG